jgi:hypothetical protein
MFEFPVFVVGLTLSVMVVVPGLLGPTFTLVGLKAAVAPPGRPFALRATAPSNPLDDVIVMVVVPLGLLERLTDTVVGLAVTVMLPPRLTVNMRLVEWLSAPLVPVTVRVYVPAGVPFGVNVKLDLFEPLIEVGLKVAVKPAGSVLVMLKPTLPVKPLSAPIAICDLVLCPCFVEGLEGEAEIVKSLAVMVSDTEGAL